MTYLEGSAHRLEAVRQGVPVIQEGAAHDNWGGRDDARW